MNPNSGIVTYVPDGGFSGADEFSYEVSDLEGLKSNIATVSVTVNGSGGGTGQTLSFTALEDGQVKLPEPGKNYGSKLTMKSEAGKFVSYIKFTVVGVSGTVERAVLQLRVADGASDGSDDGGTVYLVSNNFLGSSVEWDEDQLAGANAPVVTGSGLSSAGSVSPSSEIEFDITSAVSGNGSFSFALVSQSGNQVKYFSKEGISGPALEIQTILSASALKGDEVVLLDEQDQGQLSDEVLPTTVTLQPNYPNPFNLETKIIFGLPKAARVDLVIFNTRGQEVKILGRWQKLFLESQGTSECSLINL